MAETGIQLAKDCLDVGLYTNRIDEVRAFYEDEVGLLYEELLKAGGGVHQHRVGLNGAVFKLNADRNEIARLPTTIRRVRVASSAMGAPKVLVDPDGNEVELVPAGHEGVTQAGIVLATTDEARLGRLLAGGLGAVQEGDHAWRVGRTLLELVEEAGAATEGPMRAVGLRYLTVQVWDVFAEHQRFVDLGWTGAVAPVRLGAVAAISFVRDPDGLWLEISQRASLTGDLPTDLPRVD